MATRARPKDEPTSSSESEAPVALRTTSSIASVSRGKDDGLLSGDLANKVLLLVGLLVFSRVGVYLRLPGVDVERFAESLQGGGLLGYIDSLSGGSISNVGVFSLGIIPAINASIFLQILTTAFPGLKKLQREEGPQGRARFTFYTKLATLAFAVAQAFGQLSTLRPYVDNYGPDWLLTNAVTLVAGAMILTQVADTITEMKLGNGTSVLIFANIASALPSSVGGALTQAGTSGSFNLVMYFLAFAITTLGIVYVQSAERKIPMNYANRYRTGDLSRQSYLPFKVNATGVMPVIFSTSLLSVPSAIARFSGAEWLVGPAQSLAPGGPLYLPFNIALIVAFNYYYTFLQLDPNDLSEQLKRGGASIPGVRPGRATAEYVTNTLTRMSVLGSAFLGILAAAPAAVEAVTHLQAFRGFGGTSVLIIVGVATDTARRIRAEQAMAKYRDVDKLYDEL